MPSLAHIPAPTRIAAVAAIASAAVFAAFGLAPAAQAAERLTLANGFDVVCDHHALVEGRIRVYLKPAVADYFELNPQAISAVETVPDPQPEIKPETAQSNPNLPPPEPKSPAKTSEIRLTPTDLQQLLSKAGSEHNVDEDLLASVVKAESNGNTRAISRAGARGLMQLMPGTAQQLGVADSFQPEENIRGGASYLDGLLTRYHNSIALALAAYNAGPEAVDRYRGVPPYHETRAYVARVIHEFNRRVAARQKLAHQNASQQPSANWAANTAAPNPSAPAPILNGNE
jgi:soluble lytic murein transglycosylase-like protein